MFIARDIPCLDVIGVIVIIINGMIIIMTQTASNIASHPPEVGHLTGLDLFGQ